METKNDFKTIYFDILVKEIEIFKQTAISMNLKWNIGRHESYRKWVQVSLTFETMRDLYYFGYNFASQVTKKTIVHRYLPSTR